MYAFIFTISLFIFWGLLGFATIAVFNPRLRVIQGILISPTIGLAVTILPVFFINRLGIPVKNFGAVLFAALATTAAIVLILKRPTFPAKRLLPFIAILFAALSLAAWPMFSYGYDWTSYSNDDMANYCLAAQRFFNHGFFDPPNLDDFFKGREYSLAYWFMHVPGKVRSGSELMLASVWALSGLNAHQIFMPVIMALHLALVAGAGAMVAGVSNKARTPLIAMGLLTISPLTTLGALYQLIGQVGGLGLVTAAVTLMYRPIEGRFDLTLVRRSIPAAIVFSSIFVWYPEVLPFFGIGWLLYIVLVLKYRSQHTARVVVPTLIVGTLVVLTLNKYAVDAIRFMFAQASSGMKSADPNFSLFPYFLVPSGIAAFWGLIPIVGVTNEPFNSLLIVITIYVSSLYCAMANEKGTRPCFTNAGDADYGFVIVPSE